MAGLQVGRALGCSGCLGLGSALPAPHHVPGHPTSICDEGVNVLYVFERNKLVVIKRVDHVSWLF